MKAKIISLFNKFWNKEFLTFAIIGFVAYLVHQAIYSGYLATGWYDDKFHLLSTAIAFTFASIVSLILNAKLTYKEKLTNDNVIKSSLFFVFKFALTEGICLGVMALINAFLNPNNIWYTIIEKGLPIILTCITLVIQFLFFNIIFKKKTGDENDCKN